MRKVLRIFLFNAKAHRVYSSVSMCLRVEILVFLLAKPQLSKPKLDIPKLGLGMRKVLRILLFNAKAHRVYSSVSLCLRV